MSLACTLASRKSGPLVLLYWSRHESQRVVRWRDGTTLTSATIIFKVGKRDVRGVMASGLELQVAGVCYKAYDTGTVVVPVRVGLLSYSVLHRADDFYRQGLARPRLRGWFLRS